jgi:nicotinamide-nucleotide amidase
MTANDPIEQRVGAALRERDETLAVAESCTGGLIGSLVTHSYRAKQELLAVSREALDDHGAVSEPVAAEMARSVRDTAGTDWGVAHYEFEGSRTEVKAKIARRALEDLFDMVRNQ